MISDINKSVGAKRNGQPVLATSVVCCYSVLQGDFAIFREFSRKNQNSTAYMANSAADRLKIPRPGKTVGSTGYRHDT
jgi:hypothetical protein